MALPILPSTTDIRTITERVNPLIKFYNREDTRVPLYALDTGSATAYVIAPIPGIEQYIVGQIFVFKAANANSGTTPTLAVNGLTAGTITYPNGGALTAGDIPANAFVEVVVASTTPTFHLLTRSVAAITNTGATTFLGADVALNNVANFFNGPNTGSIGASGQVWLIIGVAQLTDTAGIAALEAAIFDGTNYIANSVGQNFAASARVPVTICAVVTLSGATTFTLRAKDPTSVSGVLKTTDAASGVANKATSITAVRLA
jgi:hypothetical protein